VKTFFGSQEIIFMKLAFQLILYGYIKSQSRIIQPTFSSLVFVFYFIFTVNHEGTDNLS